MIYLQHGTVMVNVLTGAIVSVVEAYSGYGSTHYVSYRVRGPSAKGRYTVVLGRHLRAALPGEQRHFHREDRELVARLRGPIDSTRWEHQP